MKIEDANNIYVGSSQASAVYLGSMKIWPVTPVITQIIGGTLVDSTQGAPTFHFDITNTITATLDTSVTPAVFVIDDLSSVTPYTLLYNFVDSADRSNILTLDLSNLSTSSVTSMAGMLESCSSLTSLDLTGFNISSVTSMASMFSGCSSLTTLDLSMLNVGSVTNMDYMFYGCTSLATLDLRGWQINSNATHQYMFLSCDNLTDVYINNSTTLNILTNNLTSAYDPASIYTAYYITKTATIHYNSTDYTWNGSAWV